MKTLIYDNIEYNKEDYFYKIQLNKKLILKVIDSKKLTLGDQVCVNCYGVEINGKNDYVFDDNPVTKFGSNKLFSDYVLPVEDGIQERHFDIKFDFISKEYNLRNTAFSAVFVKIAGQMVFFN